jgi:hypothetical protein
VVRFDETISLLIRFQSKFSAEDPDGNAHAILIDMMLNFSSPSPDA